MSPAQFYEKIASAIVQHPEMLSVSAREGDKVMVFADDADYGKLIGMGGRNFRACEDLLQAFAMQRNLPFVKLCVQNETKTASFPSRYEPNDQWSVIDDRLMVEFIKSLITAIFQVEVRCQTSNSGLHKGTHITVSVPCEVHDRVKEALAWVVHAVGRNRGRMVQVEVKDRHVKQTKNPVP